MADDSDCGLITRPLQPNVRLHYLTTPSGWLQYSDTIKNPVTNEDEPFISPEAEITALYVPKAVLEPDATTFNSFRNDAFPQALKHVLEVLLYCSSKIESEKTSSCRPGHVACVQMVHRRRAPDEVAGFLFTWACQFPPRKKKRDMTRRRRAGVHNSSDNDDEAMNIGRNDEEEDDEFAKRVSRMRPLTMFEAFSRLIHQNEERASLISNRSGRRGLGDDSSVTNTPAYEYVNKAWWLRWIGSVGVFSVNPDDWKLYSSIASVVDPSYNPANPSCFLNLDTAILSMQKQPPSDIPLAEELQLDAYKKLSIGGNLRYCRPFPEHVRRIMPDDFANNAIMRYFLFDIPAPRVLSAPAYQLKLLLHRIQERTDDAEAASETMEAFLAFHNGNTAVQRPSLYTTTAEIRDMRNKTLLANPDADSKALRQKITEDAGRLFRQCWHAAGDLSPSQLSCMHYLRKLCSDRGNPCLPQSKITNDLSIGGDVLASLLLRIHFVCGMHRNTHHLIKALFCALHVFLPGQHPHMLFSGEPGTGKSHILSMLSELLIPGTWMEYVYGTAKAGTAGVRNDFMVQLRHEMGPELAAEGVLTGRINVTTLAGRRQASTDPGETGATAILKHRLTSQQMTVNTIGFNANGERVDLDYKSPCNNVMCAATNLIPAVCRDTLIDRMTTSTQLRPNDGSSSAVDMLFARQTAQQQRDYEDLRTYIRRTQALFNEIGARLWTGYFVMDCSEALALVVRVLDIAAKENISGSKHNIRSVQRTVALAQVTAIVRLIGELFDSSVAPFTRSQNDPSRLDPARPFSFDDYLLLQPYLRVTTEDVVFALTLNQSEFIHPLESGLVDAIREVYFQNPLERKQCSDTSVEGYQLYYEAVFMEEAAPPPPIYVAGSNDPVPAMDFRAPVSLDATLHKLGTAVRKAFRGGTPGTLQVVDVLGDLVEKRKMRGRARTVHHSNHYPILRFSADKSKLYFAKTWVDRAEPRELILIRALQTALQHPHTVARTYVTGLPHPDLPHCWRTFTVEPISEAAPDARLSHSQEQELIRRNNGRPVRAELKRCAVIRHHDFIDYGVRRTFERQLEHAKKNSAVNVPMPHHEANRLSRVGFSVLTCDSEELYCSRFLNELGIPPNYFVCKGLPSPICFERSRSVLARYAMLPSAQRLPSYRQIFQNVDDPRVTPDDFIPVVCSFPARRLAQHALLSPDEPIEPDVLLEDLQQTAEEEMPPPPDPEPPLRRRSGKEESTEDEDIVPDFLATPGSSPHQTENAVPEFLAAMEMVDPPPPDAEEPEDELIYASRRLEMAKKLAEMEKPAPRVIFDATGPEGPRHIVLPAKGFEEDADMLEQCERLREQMDSKRKAEAEEETRRVRRRIVEEPDAAFADWVQ